MEFDKPSTKYCFITIIAVAFCAIVFMVFKMNELSNKSEAKRAAQEEACNKLDIKMFDAVKVKNDGFYGDQVFYARNKYSQTVVVALPFEDDPKNYLTFLCIDLEKVVE